MNNMTNTNKNNIITAPKDKGFKIFRGECLKFPEKSGFKIGKSVPTSKRNDSYSTDRKVAEEFACMGKKYYKDCTPIIINVVANKIRKHPDYYYFEKEVQIIGKNKVKDIEKLNCD